MGLLQIYRNKQVFGSARLTDIAERLRVPCEVLEPTFRRLADTGYALRTGDEWWLTQAGARQVDEVVAAIAGRIAHRLACSTDFAGRPDRLQVEAALSGSPSGCWCSANGAPTRCAPQPGRPTSYPANRSKISG